MASRLASVALLVGLLAGCRGTNEAGRVAVGDSFLHYETAGRGSALVFLHGGQTDLRMWDPQFDAFAGDHHVVRYDVRGYGRSGPVQAPYASHVDLHTLIEALGLERVTLVGLSLGGRIAIDYALDHPERVERLVLAAPGLTGWDWSGADHAFFDAIERAAAAGDTWRAVELWLACPYMAPAMEREELAPRVAALAHDNEHAWRIPPVETRRTPLAVECLAQLSMPTLLVVGERDVPDILRIADALERELPDLRRVDLAGVGHMLNLEAPELFDDALREFLQVAER